MICMKARYGNKAQFELEHNMKNDSRTVFKIDGEERKEVIGIDSSCAIYTPAGIKLGDVDIWGSRPGNVSVRMIGRAADTNDSVVYTIYRGQGTTVGLSGPEYVRLAKLEMLVGIWISNTSDGIVEDLICTSMDVSYHAIDL